MSEITKLESELITLIAHYTEEDSKGSYNNPYTIHEILTNLLGRIKHTLSEDKIEEYEEQIGHLCMTFLEY